MTKNIDNLNMICLIYGSLMESCQVQERTDGLSLHATPANTH